MSKKLKSFIMTILGIYYITILVICCLGLRGCSKRCDVEEVRAEFNQYQIDSDIAIVYNDAIIYFNDHSVRFSNLTKHYDDYGPYLWHISQEYIYFADIYKNDNNKNNSNIVLYQCNLYGENLQIVYEKSNVKSGWWLKNRDDSIFYFTYTINNITYIDSYDASTETLESIVANDKCKREDYVKGKEREYDINRKRDKASITKKNSSETFVVDNNYLKTTPYYESINRFPYELEHVIETKGRIFFFYRFVTEGFFEINASYTFVIFEFFYETKEMSYKYLIQADDIEALIVFIP